MTEDHGGFAVYAIRHKPTGHYLPATKYNRGSSWQEPEELGGKLGPHFFITKRGAKCALVAWVRGKFERHFSTTYDYTGCPTDHQIVKPIPVSSRKVEEMEIVKFNLVEEEYTF